MKRGFTLVEIIISISLVLIIGVSTTFIIINTNKSNIESITKQILEAANAYIKVEKDSNGNIYANEIIRGAQGVQVPLTNLVKEGYIKDSQAKEIYDYYKESEKKLNNTDTDDYYILFVQEIGGENESYCSENEITSYASWMPKGENIYLCNSYGTGGVQTQNLTLSETIIKQYGGRDALPVLDEVTIDDYYNFNQAYANLNLYITKTNGLVYFQKNSNNQRISGYYFRGNVENNYLKINGIDVLFRIYSLDDGLNLITENPIDSNYYYSSEEYLWSYDLTENNQLLNAIFLWYGDTIINNGNSEQGFNYMLFEEIQTCNEKIERSDPNPYWNYILSWDECSVFQYYASILSVYDAIATGIPPRLRSNPACTSDLGLDDTINTDAVGPETSDSFLNTGGGMLLANAVEASETSTKLLGISVPASDSLELNTACYGIILTGEYSSVDIHRMIRPTIHIKDDCATFTGSGTKTNPYIITPKEECDWY